VAISEYSLRADNGWNGHMRRTDGAYIRYEVTPGGALFEATVSKPEGFLVDEPFDQLGRSLQVPPFFADRKAELVGFLEPLRY
jgi:glyoxalase family protein